MLSETSPLHVESFDFRVLPMKTRFPFQYGIASMTSLPHLFVCVSMCVDGREVVGTSSEGLPPKWFTKDPDTTFEEDLPAMLSVIRHAAEVVTGRSAESFFDLWKGLYLEQAEWACSRGYPPLLANLGVALVERAVIDGLCRALGIPFADALRENRFGIRAGELDPDLAGADPADLLPERPLAKVRARHTIGLGDPLTDEDIEEPLGDGLPHSLAASIREYGLTRFKIKICGNPGVDLARLVRIREVLDSEAGGDYRATLDGNEQFKRVEDFREFWEMCQGEGAVRPLLDHLLFVEQPIHRDRALDDSVGEALSDWAEAPPLIIDESEADLGCLPRALELGYSGTSHKNCKGIIKGVINAMRLEARRRAGGEGAFILSGEDLANVGPIALLQDLAVMASLGIEHVERNGHHYFRGLSAMPEAMQEATLVTHGDLYREHPDGFPTLRIEDGEIEIGSVIQAPFGVGFVPDLSAIDRLE